MIVVILIISFLLDGIIFSLSSINSTISPLFSLLSLILVYPYYCNDKRKMFVCAIFVGLLYDIVYSNSLFFNTLVFTGMLYLVDQIHKVLTNSFFNTFLVSNIVICVYRIVDYLFFLVLGMIGNDVTSLINSISNSLIINYIYVIIFSFILYIVSKKLQIKRNI